MEQLSDKTKIESSKSCRAKDGATILLVEDHEEIAFGLKNNLEFDSHEVAIAGDGREGLQLLKQMSIDLIILDLMLPGMSGYEFLETVREEGNSVPVLILSAKGEEIDKVRGFRLGADDYVTKPFGTMELIARIEAILRRSSGSTNTSNLWRFGDIEVDADKRIVRKKDKELSLTPLEFELLQALLKRSGAVASRKELLEEIWNHPDNVMTRTVDTHIAELRNKLEKTPSDPDYILTVPKIGYKLKV